MRTRIISAMVGIAIMITMLIFHNTIFLTIMVSAMTAVMLFELLRAVKLEKCIPILIAIELCGISIPFIYDYTYKYISMSSVFAIEVLFKRQHILPFTVTLFCSFIVFIIWLNQHKKIRYEQVFFALASMLLVPQAMTTMVRIDREATDHGVFLLVMGLCGAWIADSGAYFTGITLGKHKLCPEISPKKTIEGFVGGIISTAVVFVIAFFVYNKFITRWPMELGIIRYIAVAVMGMICAVIGTVGDLSASMVKRQIGFKDYGKIMPGHGGLMDRFDSVLFVLPTFYAFISLTGII
ncbi:MAG: phosphatidate cytidylyltransferase [Ruminococcus sp.]|nr:phosphatidate cytidylyltransferase [Ruminococcus sp.]